MEYLISILCGYFLGSVPFGLVIAYLAGFGDIRKQGSGNIGTTNVLRITKRKDLTILTLVLDAGKAGFAALLAAWLFHNPMAGLFAGLAGVIGHNFPIWLNFKGGKGVASTLGLMLTMTPFTGILTALTWLAMAVSFKYSSLSALTALALAPVYALIFSGPTAMVFYLGLAVLSFWRHRDNIKRLAKGEESKINLKKKAK